MFLDLIPGLGRSPVEGNDKPLQYSCLGNPMDRGVWWATVHGILQARILEWVAVPFQGIFPTQGSNPGTCISCMVSRFFTTEPPRKPQLLHCMHQMQSFPLLLTFMQHPQDAKALIPMLVSHQRTVRRPFKYPTLDSFLQFLTQLGCM